MDSSDPTFGLNAARPSSLTAACPKFMVSADGASVGASDLLGAARWPRPAQAGHGLTAQALTVVPRPPKLTKRTPSEAGAVLVRKLESGKQVRIYPPRWGFSS